MAMSNEEFQQALAAVEAERQRRAAEAAATNAARLAPLVAITGSAAFTELQTAVAAVPVELVADDQIGPCIKAIKVGMANLLQFAPPPVPAPAPTE